MQIFAVVIPRVVVDGTLPIVLFSEVFLRSDLLVDETPPIS